MAKKTLTKQEILEAIKDHELTAAEGYRLITELQAGQADEAGAVRSVFYHNEWVEAELPPPPPGQEWPATVLLFDHQPQFGSLLEARWRQLSGRAVRVVLVQPGQQYQRLDHDGYRVNPANPDDYHQLVTDLKHRGWLPEGVIYLWARDNFNPQAELVDAQLDQGFFALLALSRALLEQKIQRLPLLYLYPVCQGTPQPLYEALDGFARTIRQENPAFLYKIVGIEQLNSLREPDPSPLLEIILGEWPNAAALEVAVSYTGTTRRVKQLREAQLQLVPDQGVQLRESGVYLITGGLGGLGLIFAEYLARQVRAQLVLTGRSALEPKLEARLRQLETWGATVLYVQADITVPAEVDHLITLTKQRFGALHGVIHSAGTIRDAFIIKKTRDEAAAVLAPKVAGALNLDRATQGEPLDFMVLFSSIAAVLGNVGQSDYAFGNSFLDHFAAYREAQKRPGATIAINWPLWREGGMRIAEAEFAVLAAATGLQMLPTTAGLEIWETVLQNYRTGGPTHYAALYGDAVKIRQALQPGATPAAASEAQTTVAVDFDRLLEPTQQYLREIFSELLNMELDQINPDTNFREYGIDSIVVKLFNVKLEQQLGSLPKTLLFEYQTLRELNQYLVQNYGAKLVEVLGEAPPPTPPPAQTSGVAAGGWDELQPLRAKYAQTKRQPLSKAGEMEIAIIGLSGAYPQATDLEEFWENLKNGRDCIEEIPADRWDYRDYFDPDMDKAKDGKIYCKWGSFLKGIDRFDPLFFSISPREAEIMDPQERLLLQTAWAALEDAGYTRGQLAKLDEKEQPAKVGVFIGATNYSYNLVCADEWAKGNKVLTNSAPWSLANRISFLLNFHGPSLPVDTACSSSLTAVHLACESIKKGECQVALAGGINLYCHPSKYVGMSQLRMLSPTGKCYSFGAQSDGIVPGEGVGIILLKPLAQAIADQDHIYAVIKGSSINHGGNTNAFTVPNPNAHAALILEALEKAEIDPRTISYVEAHGTGTALGDPIEIAGLTKAYRRFTAEAQYCAIGSVKANIGHLEAAAGIAGITKLLLQLKHRQLAPSIHARELNPNIDFANSPFYVQQELTDWETPSNPGAPRRMAISSFGAGGSNAHLILEEYQAPPRAAVAPQGPALIVLSARNPERLQAYAAKLAGFLEKRLAAGEPDLSLLNLAYTLQVGREALGHRLAVLATDLPELQQKLTQYAQGITEIADCFYASLKAGKGAGLPEAAEVADGVSRVLQQKDWSCLAELWLRGADIPWQKLYSGVTPRRITLPTYPFAAERYWIEQVPAKTGVTGAMKLDTLIDANISTLEEQCFRKRFAGDEFFLTDHGTILPGAVYLEMVRAAGNLANPRSRVVKLRNVVWANPIIIDRGGRDVQVSFTLAETGIGFEVSTRDETGAKQLHSQGKVVYEAPAVPEDGPPSLDIAEILRRCQGGTDRAAVYYEQLAALDVVLGHRFKGMYELFYNETEAVGLLALPPELEAGRSDFQMHPTLIDGGFQTVFAHVLSRRLPEAETLCLPFVLGELTIINPKLRICYAYVQTVNEYNVALHQPIKYNIWFLDQSGQIAVQMTDYSIRPVELKTGADQVKGRSGPATALLYCRNVWGPSALVSGSNAVGPADCLLIFDRNEALAEALRQRRSPAAPPVILVKPGTRYRKLGETSYEINPAKPEDYQKLLEVLHKLKLTPNRIVHWWSQELFADAEAQLRHQLVHGIHSCFHLCQALLKRKLKSAVKLIYLYSAPDGVEQPQYAAVGSFAKSVRLEQPSLVIKTVALEGQGDLVPQHLTNYLLAEFQPAYDQETEIRYRDGERSVRKLAELERPARARTAVPLREQGVYLITGGAGALGLIMAEYLANKVKARIILTGRSDLRPAVEARLQRLSATGSEVLYLKADLGEKREVDRLLAQIKTRFPVINGVIHCAGLIRDALLTNKTLDDWEQVLLPKVFGTFNLDQALQGEALDFFVLFSSTTAMLGNVGQTDYAYANSFLDHFAAWRAAQGRNGVTLAINWPLWKDGGMQVDEATLQLFAALGIEPLTTPEGLALFEQGFSLAASHFMVMKGNLVKLRERLGLQAASEGTVAEVSLTQRPDEQPEIAKRLLTDLLQLIAGILKITAEAIDPEGELGQLGFDSITFTELANALNAKYRLEVTPTVFFAYATPGSVAAHLWEEYGAQIADYYRNAAQPALKFRPIAGELRAVGDSRLPSPTPSGGEPSAIREQFQSELCQLVARILKLPVAGIDLESELSQFGFDSISFTELANAINAQYRLEITPTLFFAHRSLEAVAAYLWDEYGARIGQHYQSLAPRDRDAVAAAAEPLPMRSGLLPALPLSETADQLIAIIGVGGVLPQSENPDHFWQNLVAKKDLITEVPKERWDWEQYYGDPHAASDKTSSKWGGFIADVDKFDPLFFNIAPRDAERMDPQERIMIETVWKTIEDAGYRATDFSGTRTGLFIGVSNADYKELLIENRVLTALTQSLLANRISYLLNLRGPSEPVDTACSSSLVAIHRAVEAIRSGECDMALAGGVNIIVSPNLYISQSQAGMLAPDGRCKTFDQAANGYVRGEGAGVILLKPLAKAQADGDQIYAIIRGTAVNHGGHGTSLTAPNSNAQAELLIEAYEKAQINPATVSYIEAHGTGTNLGDPIEIDGLTKAFKTLYQKWNLPAPRKPHCGIGAVKTNIGHLEAASGIAGVIKVLWAMKHQTLPANLHFKEANPYLQLEKSPFYLVTQTKAWARLKDAQNQELPRRAGVSSFGIGGVNAHVILEEYQNPDREGRSSGDRSAQLFVLSAKDPERLREYARLILGYLEARLQTSTKAKADVLFADLIYTLQVGREPLEERLAIIVTNLTQLRGKLQQYLEQSGPVPGLYQGGSGTGVPQPDVTQGDVNVLIQQRDLNQLARLWVANTAINWRLLYPAQTPRRISLPTYPFARERYWIQAAAPGANPGGVSQQKRLVFRPKGLTLREAVEAGARLTPTSPLAEPTQLMTFTEEWTEQPLETAPPAQIKNLICLLSSPRQQAALLETIKAAGGETEIIFISPSEKYQRNSRESYQISVADPQTWREAFANIQADYGVIDGLLYLWPLDDSESIADYSRLVQLLQAIAGAQLKVARVMVAAQFRNALEQCYIESWVGFERSLGLVLPHTKLAVCCAAAAPGSSGNEWLATLWLEMRNSRFQSVLYQDGKRLSCQIRPTALPEAVNYQVRRGGTYLITGGCGGLGLLFAEHLAKQSDLAEPVKLILTGRSPLDAAKQAKLKALESLGSRVLYLQADVCDPEAMQQGLAKAQQHFGPVHGVIHAAGIAANRSVLEKGIEDFQKVLDPKINGALILDQLLGEAELDFICYFSSSAAIIGDTGSCDYAVGNRFLMAYAHYRKEQQLQKGKLGKTYVINWPLWRAGGMGPEEPQATEMYLKSSGQRELESAEGLAVFDRILTQTEVQHLILVGQPGRIRRFLGLVTESGTKPGVSGQVVDHLVAEGLGSRAELQGLSIEQCLEWDLKELISNLVKVNREKIRRDKNLADYGFDSLNLAEFARVLTRYYGIEISPSLFFGYSTVEQLTAYFLREQSDRIGEFYRAATNPEAGTVREVQPAVMPQRGKERLNRWVALRSVPPGTPEGIAIVGMSGRFPEARNIEEMWEILIENREVVRELPSERLNSPGEKFKGKCGFVPGVSEFEPLFFEISPKEAESMDPRQRLLLQEAWRALEDAGYGTKQLKEQKIGMFVGVEQGDYQLLVPDEAAITSNHNAILASRLAYFLNLNGPVLALDTACSSGLVAAHQAVLSLRNGECDAAIVAGVNLLLTATPYLKMSQAGMLSPDGRCYAFDQRASGLVPGEAVAVVVLKRLSRAEADGDPIYAVIKGSGINYDGKTNGITAPSGVAQTNLLKTVYEQCRVNPEAIEYVVTHGTGTRLGDPVEVNALNDAFKMYTGKRKYAALTSTKPNFGHSFAASGLVSLISLVQAMRYATIPASLNCDQLNDYINWSDSPFFVNKTNRPWVGRDGKPGLGAVSAFGMSGTNAHLVVEAYREAEPAVAPAGAPAYLLVLSAKTPESLAEKVLELITVLEQADANLTQISYTLLEGRQHFSCRCAVVSRNREEAIAALKQIGTTGPTLKVFQGMVEPEFTGDPALARSGNDLLTQVRAREAQPSQYQESLVALAELYCQGYGLDWGQMFGPTQPKRIHLPTYPFTREQYWVAGSGVRPAAGALVNLIHPLIHENTSTLLGQRFSSTFTGQEFFLADHIVKGQSVLPGAAFLELARVAVAISGEAPVQTLRNLVWLQPLTLADQPLQIQTGVYPRHDTVEVEVSTTDQNNQKTVYFQCQAGLESLPASAREDVFDLDAIKQRCPLQKSGAEFYPAFREVGLAFGPAFQSLHRVYANEAESLAELVVAPGLTEEFQRFGLHPTLIDGGFQTITILVSLTLAKALYLPFALEELRIYGPLEPECYAYAVPADQAANPAGVKKFNIFLLDQAGRVAVAMKHYAIREVKPDGRTVSAPDAPSTPGVSPEGASSAQELLALLQKLENGELNATEVEDLLEVKNE